MANDIKRMKVRLVCKHDKETNWNAAVNFKPLAGELIIYDEDNTHSTPRFKVGDGNTLVNNLPFYPSGDVTVAGNNIFTGNNSFKTITSFENDIIFNKTPVVTNDIFGIGKNGIRVVGKMNTEMQTIKFPDFSNFGITTHTIPLNDTDNIFTGTNTFNNGGFKVNSSYGVEALSIDPLNSAGTMHTGMTTLKSAIDQYCSITLGAGSVSISSKGTNNNTGHIDISTGINGVDFNIAGVTSAVKVLSDGIKVNSKTKYCGGKIDNIVSGTTYSLTLPSKSGTFALTSDVSNYIQANPTAVTSVLTSIKIGNISYGIGGGVSLSGNNTWTGSNTFNNINIASGKINNQNTELSLPTISGTLALTSDLPIKTATLSGSTLSITLNSTNGDSSTSTNSIY